MSASTMGRRYERLLFFAGPLAPACLLILFVALASDRQEDRRRAKCLRSAADLIKEHQGELTKPLSGGRAAIRENTTDS